MCRPHQCHIKVDVFAALEDLDPEEAEDAAAKTNSKQSLLLTDAPRSSPMGRSFSSSRSGVIAVVGAPKARAKMASLFDDLHERKRALQAAREAEGRAAQDLAQRQQRAAEAQEAVRELGRVARSSRRATEKARMLSPRLATSGALPAPAIATAPLCLRSQWRDTRVHAW